MLQGDNNAIDLWEECFGEVGNSHGRALYLGKTYTLFYTMKVLMGC